MTTNYSPSHASGVTVEGTITEDKLNDRNSRTAKVTIRAGTAHVRGELLGKVAQGAVTSAAKAGGNTGNGTFVPDATTPFLAYAEPGAYTARFTTTTNIRLESTLGAVLADIPIVATTGQTATISERVKGLVTQGSVTFAVGDGFDITVAAGSGKYDLSAAAAIDGTQVPDAILLHDADATSADQEAIVAIATDACWEGVILGAGHTQASVNSALRSKGIFLTKSIG